MARIEGLAAIERAFGRLSKGAEGKILAALNQGADEIVRDAKALAPTGEDDIRMRDSIRKTTAALTTSSRGRSAGSDRGVAVFVVAGDTVETSQAAFRSEFGRAPSADGHPGHRAQPFLFPAYFRNRRRIRARIARALRAAAQEAARGR